MIDRDRVEILPIREFLRGPQSVIPSGSDNPFARAKFLQPRAHPLLQFVDGLRTSQVYLQLDVGAGRQMKVRVVESGHRKLPMQIDDTSLWPEPRFHLRFETVARAAWYSRSPSSLTTGGAGDSDDMFAAHGYGAGPWLRDETRIDSSVRQHQIGRRFERRRQRGCSRKLSSAGIRKDRVPRNFRRANRECQD